MNHEIQRDANDRIIRVVDWRIPIWGLLGVIVFISWSAITIWFQVSDLNRTVVSLQIAVSGGNNLLSSITSDVALLKFREGILEDAVKKNSEESRSK